MTALFAHIGTPQMLLWADGVWVISYCLNSQCHSMTHRRTLDHAGLVHFAQGSSGSLLTVTICINIHTLDTVDAGVPLPHSFAFHACICDMYHMPHAMCSNWMCGVSSGIHSSSSSSLRSCCDATVLTVLKYQRLHDGRRSWSICG